MTRFLALVFFLLSAMSISSAQVTKPQESASSVAGTVVGEPGSHPLKKVIVQAIAEDPRKRGNYSTVTDSDGRFRVENVVPGRYRVFFEKTGFVEVNSRGQKAEINVVTVPAGQSVEDLMFRMLPTAVITGRVTDEDGDPMIAVRVEAQKRVPGKAKREAVSAAMTDDLGEYRLAGLFPGHYWIAAMPPPDVRDYEKWSNKEDSGKSPTETRYLTTFYPGTNDGTQASLLTLKAGEEMPVNLTLVPARTYRVRGVVTGVAAGQLPIVELTSKTGDSMHASEVGSDGQFEVRGAAPGSYVLKATQEPNSGTLTARQEITVVAADVEGIKLAPMPAFTLSGHVRMDTAEPLDFSRCAVNLLKADLPDDPGLFMSQDSFDQGARVDWQGNFTWKNVSPGTYVVQLYGWNRLDRVFVKSARIGGRNIDDGFTVSGPAVLELVVSSKSGLVEGVVTSPDHRGNDQDGGGQDENDRPASNVAVVAVPEEKYRKNPERFGVGATDQYGNFTIRGLAPGSYTLFAWQDVNEELYRDPDFLKSQGPNGIAVKIDEDSRQKVDLKLSAVSDDWR